MRPPSIYAAVSSCARPLCPCLAPGAPSPPALPTRRLLQTGRSVTGTGRVRAWSSSAGSVPAGLAEWSQSVLPGPWPASDRTDYVLQAALPTAGQGPFAARPVERAPHQRSEALLTHSACPHSGPATARCGLRYAVLRRPQGLAPEGPAAWGAPAPAQRGAEGSLAR